MGWLSSARLTLGRFRAAYDELAAEEFLVVQFFDGAFGFFDRLHLHESETFGALVMAVAHYLGVLHVADAVEEFEEIAFRRLEGQVADVKPRRRDFNGLRFARGPRRGGAIARHGRGFLCAFAVSEKCSQPLPECFLWCFRLRPFLVRPTIAPASGPAARTPRASPGGIRVHVYA